MYGRFDWKHVCVSHLRGGFGGRKREWDSLELELEKIVWVDAETRTWALWKNRQCWCLRSHLSSLHSQFYNIVISITLFYVRVCLPKAYVWRLGPKPVRVWVPVEVKSWRACCWRSIETLTFPLFLSCVSWAPWSEQVPSIICSHHNKLVHPGPWTETSEWILPFQQFIVGVSRCFVAATESWLSLSLIFRFLWTSRALIYLLFLRISPNLNISYS